MLARKVRGMTDKEFIYGGFVHWIGTEHVGRVISCISPDNKIRVVFERGIYSLSVEELERVNSLYPTWKELDDLKAKLKEATK